MELMMEVLAVFQKGGLVMYPLLACSILAIGIGVERYSAFRLAEASPGYLKALIQELDSSCWEAALVLSTQEAGVIPPVIAAAIRRQREGIRCQSQLENAAALVSAKLKNRLHYLDTVVTLSPLLGLLGTVVGMIHSFNVMNVVTGQPHAITGGIGEALIATAFGLCVAVLALVIHSYYTQRLDRIITDMEQCFNALLEAADRGMKL